MTAMPKNLNLLEQQIPTFTTWDRVYDINNILADLEAGVFFNASLLTTQLLRDDRFRGCMNVRVHSLLGMAWHMEAAKISAKKKATKIADAATAAWPRMAPRSEMAEILKWSILLGMAPSQKLWDRKPDEWTPSLKFWHPGAVYYDLMADTYKLQYNGGIIEIPPDDPNWVLATPYGYKYGRLNGLLSAIAIPTLARQWAMRDRARYSETCGQPMKQIIAPSGALPAELNAARRSVSTQGSESVIVTKQGAEGNKWGYALIEASGQSSDLFAAEIAHLDEVLAVAVLGQTMSTQGQGGLGAHVDAGGTVRRDVMRFDAQTLSFLASNLLRDWARINYGDPDLAPTLCVEVDPPEDEERKARVLGLVADAVIKFQQARVNVNVENICEEAGVPLLDNMPATEEPEAAGMGPREDPADAADVATDPAAEPVIADPKPDAVP